MLPRRLSTGLSYTPIGAMSQKIDLKQPGVTQDSTGALVRNAFTTFAASIWASIQSLQGRELYAAQQVVAQVTHKVVINYLPNVKAKMLVKYGDRTYQIEYVSDPDNRKVQLNLLCIERNDSAYEPTP